MNSPYSQLGSRNTFLDAYRGSAVLLMIIFHFCWDLREFNYINYSLADTFWTNFRSVIVFLFLTAVGWSTYISKTKETQAENHPKKFLVRQVKLLLSASSISLITYIAFPSQWIYFGILHFIFLVSFIHYPFACYPWLSAIIGLTIGLVFFLTNWLQFPKIYHVIVNELGAPKYTLDIVYPFPWIACVFIGPVLAKTFDKIRLQNSSFVIILNWLGRHALGIYLLHQIMLYSLVSGATFLIKRLS